MTYRANIIGATGLVGTALTKQLIEDENCSEIRVFGRSKLSLSHPKLNQYLINFDLIENWSEAIQGDVLYNCMGTTIKKAGSKEKQRLIDVTYPFEIARAAKRNGIECMLSVSANGANAKSSLFYNRIKGELEEALKVLRFQHLVLIRPSLLIGDRAEKRIGEKVAEGFMSIFKYLPVLNKIQPIHVDQVAKSMLHFTHATNSALIVAENQDLLAVE